MFTSPMTINIDAAGLPDLPDLSFIKVQESNGISDWIARDPGVKEWRMRIRQSKETARNGAPAYRRINVELALETFATATTPATIETAYFVLRKLPFTDDVPMRRLVSGLSELLFDVKLTSLLNGEV